MDDPPILPPGNPDPPISISPETNPYAPVDESAFVRPKLGQTQLTSQYWMILGAALLLFILATFIQPALGAVCLVGLLGAAIRVPLLQRRLTMASPQRAQPNMFAAILLSWLATLLIGFASIVAFCAICFPIGVVTFSANESSIAVSLVFGVSGLIGLGVFLFLFSLSLRLPI